MNERVVLTGSSASTVHAHLLKKSSCESLDFFQCLTTSSFWCRNLRGRRPSSTRRRRQDELRGAHQLLPLLPVISARRGRGRRGCSRPSGGLQRRRRRPWPLVVAVLLPVVKAICRGRRRRSGFFLPDFRRRRGRTQLRRTAQCPAPASVTS